MKRLFNTIAVIVFAVILSVGAVACGSGSNTETEKSSEVVRSTDESKKDTDLKTSQKKGTKKEESDKKSDSAASADKSDKDAAKESSTSADQSSSNASSNKSDSSSSKPSGSSSSSHSGSSASKPSSNTGSSKPSSGNSGSTSMPEPSQPAHQHSYTSSVTTQPTCSTPGVRTYTCVSGDDSYTESIPATGHNWIDNVETVEHSDPIWKVVCNGCGAQFNSAEDAISHVMAVFGDSCSNYSSKIVGYNTYSETVSHGQICSVCGAAQ